MDITSLIENLRLLGENFGENPTYLLGQAAVWVTNPGGLFFDIIRIFFIIIGLILIGGVIYFLINTTYLRYRILQDLVEFFTYKPYGVRKLGKTWMKIMGRLETMNESEYKLAIIEADDLLDDILRRMGYVGSNLEERLSRLTAATLPNIAEVFQAHVIRNSIVHDPDFHLTLDQARKTLGIFEQALQYLQALE